MSDGKKRQLSDSEDIQEDIRQMYKQIYEENLQKIQDQQKQLQQPQESQQLKEQQSSVLPHFYEGQCICNKLTQYPKEDLKDYMYSFRELLSEKPKEINMPKTLQTALMTTYGFEHELLEPIVKSRVKLLLVNDNSVDKNKDIIEEQYSNYLNWKLVMPAKMAEGVRFAGAFHPKIWILKFPNFIRILIGSQNLHIGDWTIWSQFMWVQDFIQKQLNDKSQMDPNDLEFKNMLHDFLNKILPKQINYQNEIELKLDDYEIKNIKIRLVCSIPSTYRGNQMYQYGSMRILSVVLEELKKSKSDGFKNPVITYQSTSLGDINQIFLDQLTKHFCGKQYKKSISNDQKTLQQTFSKEGMEQSEFRLIFPTQDYINNQTHGGPEFACTLFLRLESFKKNTFPKQIFHKFEGSEYYYWHTGAIPHLKVFIITEKDMQINDMTIIYVGSHNLSYGAWGKLEKNESQLNICNTELGVLYPPEKGTMIFKKDLISRLVFKFPPEKYGQQDQPFIQELAEHL